jgi:hypothetical protein
LFHKNVFLNEKINVRFATNVKLMHRTYTIFLLLFFVKLSAQTFVGNILLSTQADVDSFPLKYPNIKYITGMLRIGITDTLNSSNIKNLTPIAQQGVNRVENLVIALNDSLLNLTGLGNIDTTVSIIIWRNGGIKNLIGLNSLRRVTLSFKIQENNHMENLVGLGSEINDMEVFSLVRNPSLKSLEGGGAIKVSDSYLYITDNDSLITLSGLTGLRDCLFFTVNSNDALTHFGAFPGFSNLPNAKIGFRIYDNKSLVDFSEMENQVPNVVDLEIYNNDKLQSLKGLNGIKQCEGIYIHSNPQLKTVVGMDSLKNVNFVDIQGQAIDSIHFPELRYVKRSFKVHDCTSLTRLVNIFPKADSILGWFAPYGTFYDDGLYITKNPNLKWIHEDIGPHVLQGTKIVNNPKLETISGFNGLVRTAHLPLTEPSNIEGIFITPIGNLKKIIGFNNMVAGSMLIADYDSTAKFERIDGFNNLKYTFGKWDIDCNHPKSFPAVIKGFNNLKTSYGSLRIAGTRDTLDAFHNLDSLNNCFAYFGVGDSCFISPNSFQNLRIVYNYGFSNANYFGKPVRLPSLEIAGGINTNQNNSLKYLDNLYPKVRKSFGIYARLNKNLLSMNDFPNLSYMQTFASSKLCIIVGNDSLKECTAICNILEQVENQNISPTFVEINNLMSPCNVVAEIQAWCDTLTSVQEPITAQNEIAASMWLIYPNPLSTGETMTLDCKSPINEVIWVRCVNAISKEDSGTQWQKIEQLPATIPTRHLKSGLYWLQVRTLKGVTGLPFSVFN